MKSKSNQSGPRNAWAVAALICFLTLSLGRLNADPNPPSTPKISVMGVWPGLSEQEAIGRAGPPLGRTRSIHTDLNSRDIFLEYTHVPSWEATDESICVRDGLVIGAIGRLRVESCELKPRENFSPSSLKKSLSDIGWQQTEKVSFYNIIRTTYLCRETPSWRLQVNEDATDGIFLGALLQLQD